MIFKMAMFEFQFASKTTRNFCTNSLLFIHELKFFKTHIPIFQWLNSLQVIGNGHRTITSSKPNQIKLVDNTKPIDKADIQHLVGRSHGAQSLADTDDRASITSTFFNSLSPSTDVYDEEDFLHFLLNIYRPFFNLVAQKSGGRTILSLRISFPQFLPPLPNMENNVNYKNLTQHIFFPPPNIH